jgi:hypothetical protein
MNNDKGEMRARYNGKENSVAGSPKYRKYNLNRHEKVHNFFRPRFYDQTSWSETSLNNTLRHTRTGSVFENDRRSVSENYYYGQNSVRINRN